MLNTPEKRPYIPENIGLGGAFSISITAVVWGFEWLSEPTPGKILSRPVGQSTWVLEHNLGGDLLRMWESSQADWGFRLSGSWKE